MKKLTGIIVMLLVSLFSLSIYAQGKKTLTTEDYDQWQSLRSAVISQNGIWTAYQITVAEGNDTLFIVNTITDSVYEEAFGSRLQFTADSKFATYMIGVSKKEKEKLTKAKKSVHYKLAILNLESGEKDIYPEVSSLTLPKEGPYVILNMYKAKDSKAKGTDRVLYNLKDKSMRTLGNITSMSFNKTGNLLAYITEPANAVGYGVEVIDLNKNTTRILASDTTSFSRLSWEKEGRSLAFFHLLKNKDYKEDSYEIIAYRNVGKDWNKEVFNPCQMNGFPEMMRVSNSRIQWAEDMSSVFFGIQKQELSDKKKKEIRKEEEDAKKEAEADKDGEQDEEQEGEKEKDGDKDKKKDIKKDEKLPGVDIWHWKDPEIQPRQKMTYNSDKNFSFLCMWDLDANSFRQISDSTLRDVRLTGDQKFAIVSSEEPYEPQFRMTYADYYIMNLKTGDRKELLKNFTGAMLASPDGKYVLYFKDRNWYSYDIESAAHVNLTGSQGVPFWNTRDDHPAEVRPPWGYAEWTKEDKYVMLNDEYDVWAFKPDGSEAIRLTQGRSDENRFRIKRLDYEKEYFDTKDTWLFSVSGDKTKKSGFYSMKWRKSPVELIFVDKAISSYSLSKAKKAERYIWTESTYEQSPTLLVADADLTNAKLIVQTNPQQKDFAWGKAELIEYTNKNGKELQGVLHYPANYEEGKQYPMLVYIYEILSNNLHRYINPSAKSFYNITNYVQQGFFVFQPDIVYRLDDPGFSAVECVVPAVEKVISTGMIDRAKIGLMGHSWGAYQTAFIITQTDLFSAAVAGAPLTDMISMYTEIYWNSGSPNQGIFETSQGRFTKPYWEIMDKYIENSPMFQAQNIKTPFLVAFGNKDGAVDWHQGIELYSTMRRMEKPFVMLVYEGENHAVRKKENALDYTKKINEWFNCYLLKQEPSKWITDGIPYLEKMKKEEEKKKK